VVDVPKNNFVPGGKLAYVHDAAVVAGQDGSGAFYKLLAENAALPAAQKVDFLRQAQPLFLSLEDGVPGPAAAATIDFRDFDVGAAYSATLVPYFEGTGATLKSSFYIAVERKAADGTVKKYTVGTPALKRPLVSAYRIRRALVAPKDGSLIFVVELWKQGATGPDLRYMVEALRL
jgi:predicted secreted protein